MKKRIVTQKYSYYMLNCYKYLSNNVSIQSKLNKTVIVTNYKKCLIQNRLTVKIQITI